MGRASKQIAKTVVDVLRTVSIYAPFALQPSATEAQSSASAILGSAIPAQPLDRALAAFAELTGVQLVYVSGVAAGHRSRAVPAGISVDAALTRLLEGTGLSFEHLTAETVRIYPAPVKPEPKAEAPADEALVQVVVTATRREESLQDIPITVQALTGDRLKELNVSTFNDLLKYSANVSYSGNGPGTGNIIIRGLGTVGSGNQTQSLSAPFPNVALYLDEQAMQFPARNNDVYAIDLDRIEILEGPQGTLFGGGAQAGAIRLLTKKPDLAAVTGEFNAGYGITAGGDPNNLFNGILNLPVVADRFAVRAVAFLERRGGYIANVPGSIYFDLPPPARGISPVGNNSALTGPNTNPVTYGGFRFSALSRLDDDWNLLIQQNYQNMTADGYFYAYPADPNGKPLGARQITAFTPAFTHDRYVSTALTLNGRFADLKLLYAGSYMIRNIDGQQDYSNYLRTFGAYYSCIGPGAGYFNSKLFPVLAHKPLQCYAPVGSWRDLVRNTHQSHEIRLSTRDDRRVRALIGAYWEKFVIQDNMNFNYLDIPQCSAKNLAIALGGGPDCLSAVGPLPGSPARDPGLRENMNNAFGDEIQRGYKQYAFFASFDFDIVPKVLTLTLGTRRYHYDEFEEGSVWETQTSSSAIVDHLNGTCTARGNCGFPVDLAKSESGFRSRANLTWHVQPDLMLYYTFSQGFRPGGFNRVYSVDGQAIHRHDGILAYCNPLPLAGPIPPTDPKCRPGGALYGRTNTFQYVHPVGYKSDNLIDNEIGFKGEFLDHRLRFNAAAYLMHWVDVQSLALGLFALTSYVNGPTYTSKGLELQLLARVTEGLTVEGSSSWNSARQSTVPCLKSSGVTPSTPINPTPAGQCITVVVGQPFQVGALNTSAPFAPSVVFNLRARYDWSTEAGDPFAWFGVSHTGAQRNEPGNFPDGNAPGSPQLLPLLRYPIPAYTTYDAAVGISRDNWTAQLSGSNLSNSAAATNVSFGQYIKATVPLRPRVLMAQLSYRF